MPIRVEDFLASLSGHIQALPAIAALRLCNVFGKGDACFLNRLPTELVDLIEVYVHIASRETAYAEWKQQKQCAWDKCTCDCPQCQHQASRKSNASLTAQGARKNPGILALTAGARGFTRGVMPHVCPHQTNLHDFSLRTRDFRSVDADAKLVKRHFGLDVWTSVKHSYDIHPDDVWLRPLPMHLPAFDKSFRQDGDQHGRQLFLMLPGSITSIQASFDSDKLLKKKFMKEPCPDGKMIRRFLRACRLLGLRYDRDLSSLERFADKGDDVDIKTNEDLQVFAPLAGLGEMGEGRPSWQLLSLYIVTVDRASSWESRMQSAWLKRESS